MKACSPPRWSEQRSPGTTTTTLCSHCSRMSPTSSPRLTHWSSRSGRSAEWPRGLGEQRTTTSCGTTRFLVPEVPRASERNQSGTTSPQPSRTPPTPSARPSIERRQASIQRALDRCSSPTSRALMAEAYKEAAAQRGGHESGARGGAEHDADAPRWVAVEGRGGPGAAESAASICEMAEPFLPARRVGEMVWVSGSSDAAPRGRGARTSKRRRRRRA